MALTWDALNSKQLKTVKTYAFFVQLEFQTRNYETWFGINKTFNTESSLSIKNQILQLDF